MRQDVLSLLEILPPKMMALILKQLSPSQLLSIMRTSTDLRSQACTALLKKEANVEGLFLWAAEVGSKTILKKLTDREMTPDYKRKAFFQAAENGHLACVKHLYKTYQGDITPECQEDAFKWASANHSDACLAYLDEQYGSDISIETKETAFRLAAVCSSLSCLLYLSERYEDTFCVETKKAALFSMLCQNHLPAVKIFWEKWAGEIPNEGKKALLYHSVGSEVGCLQYLNEKCKIMLSGGDKITLFKIAVKMDSLDSLKYIWGQYKKLIPKKVVEKAIQETRKSAFKAYLKGVYKSSSCEEGFEPLRKTLVNTPFSKEKENVCPREPASSNKKRISRDVTPL